MLFLCTLQHFAVDGICGAALAAYAVNENFLEPIIFFFGLYNLIAFGTQFFVGWLLDRRTDFLSHAPIIALILLAAGCVDELGMTSQVILLGAGNSLFHVAAGSVILRRYSTFKEPGIFVSSGAIGLALGLNSFVDEKIFLAVYAAAATIFFFRGEKFSAPDEKISPQKIFELPATVMIVCAILLLGCVVLRSFGGGGGSAENVMLFPCIFACGKILGGVVCDKVGYKNTIALIFLTSFLALQFDGLIAAAVLTLAFNMTMPLTLRLIHWCNPKYPAMMFGLAAGCLLPGVFAENFNVVPQAMVVVQFLALFAAGNFFVRFRKAVT